MEELGLLLKNICLNINKLHSSREVVIGEIKFLTF